MPFFDDEFKKDFKKTFKTYLKVGGALFGGMMVWSGVVAYNMVQNKNTFLKAGFIKSGYDMNTYFKLMDSTHVEVKNVSDKDKSEVFDFANKRIYIRNGDMITSKYNAVTETMVSVVNDDNITMDQYLSGNYDTPDIDEGERLLKLQAADAFRKRNGRKP